MSAPNFPQPKHVPASRAVLSAFDGVPLIVVMGAFNSYPFKQCPRRSCQSSRVMLEGEGFACFGCGLLGGGAAFAAGRLWDWDFDTVCTVLGR